MNGERNGKAKYYDENGKLEFEGTIKHGILIGTKYDKNGDIIFQSYEEKGKIKEYNFDDKLIFEGEYLNGKKMEKGKNMIKIN